MGWSHQGTPLYLSSIAAVNLNTEENQGRLELPEIEFVQQQQRNCNLGDRQSAEGLGPVVFLAGNAEAGGGGGVQPESTQ